MWTLLNFEQKFDIIIPAHAALPCLYTPKWDQQLYICNRQAKKMKSKHLRVILFEKTHIAKKVDLYQLWRARLRWLKTVNRKKAQKELRDIGEKTNASTQYMIWSDLVSL